MEFRIADTFTGSLARLTGDEQKAVKTTAFDLQMNPANPGMQFHKLDKARDKNFWSVRVNRDIRLIVHKTDASFLLCYVDHHDDAYRWAERRKLEVHPRTGAAQLVEIVERVEEIVVRCAAPQTAAMKQRLFAECSDEELLTYGVPQAWLAVTREANEDELLDLAEHLPAEAAEMLLTLATEGKAAARARMIFNRPNAAESADILRDDETTLFFEDLEGPALDILESERASEKPPADVRTERSEPDPFAHPDAQRRFRLIRDSEELRQALDAPWEKWTIFLHPTQRDVIERRYSGPARVAGSAGTGKTVVALHRAVHLARANPDARVLLTTFSEPLANNLRSKLRRLIGSEPRLGERIDVAPLDVVARRVYEAKNGKVKLANEADIRALLDQAVHVASPHRFTVRFLLDEWHEVVDAWQLTTWESYRDVKRLGRKTRLPEKQREALWSIFASVRHALHERGIFTASQIAHRAAEAVAARTQPPFDCIVVDESQDVSVAQLRFLAAFGARAPDRLFFAGDLGQRIFQTPFSWKSLGVDVRGRSQTLRVNYRTSHQIRAQADRLLAPEVSDVDGNVEDRREAISVLAGPAPEIAVAKDAAAERGVVMQWLAARVQEGVLPHEIGVFVRSSNELARAQAALSQANVPFKALDEHVETTHGFASLSTMHLAKGLEFRVVVVMGCDDEVIPSQARIETVADEADLEEVYSTERHLLYVACTRARDQLLVTGVEPASEFLDDLKG